MDRKRTTAALSVAAISLMAAALLLIGANATDQRRESDDHQEDVMADPSANETSGDPVAILDDIGNQTGVENPPDGNRTSAPGNFTDPADETPSENVTDPCDSGNFTYPVDNETGDYDPNPGNRTGSSGYVDENFTSPIGNETVNITPNPGNRTGVSVYDGNITGPVGNESGDVGPNPGNRTDVEGYVDPHGPAGNETVDIGPIPTESGKGAVLSKEDPQWIGPAILLSLGTMLASVAILAGSLVLGRKKKL